MKIEHKIIIIGCLVWGSLYIVGDIAHTIGGFLSDVFNGTIFEQSGDAITSFGDFALAAFWMILVMGVIITLGVIYLKARTTS
jgi:hypothetical protein